MTAQRPSKPSVPESPKHLRPETAAWWQAVNDEFVLDAAALRLLQACCESWDRMQEAREALAKFGTTFLDRFNQPHARPEVAIERDAKISFARLLRELNLDLEPPQQTSRPPRRNGAR